MLSSDGSGVGTVAQVEGDKDADIFDGLAVQSGDPARVLYVAGEQVGAIYPGEVTLKLAAGEAGALPPFQPAPPETTWHAGKPSLMTRLGNMLRGKR